MTPWTVACQDPLSMGFPRQEHWNRLPFPSPGDLPDLWIELVSPELVGGFFTHEPPGKHRRVNVVWYLDGFSTISCSCCKKYINTRSKSFWSNGLPPFPKILFSAYSVPSNSPPKEPPKEIWVSIGNLLICSISQGIMLFKFLLNLWSLNNGLRWSVNCQISYFLLNVLYCNMSF